MANSDDHTLVYLAAPYSGVEDKEELMRKIMTISGNYMMEHPGYHIVSPLFNHYSLHLVPGMGSDYNFWGDYSRNLLKRCDLLLVVMFPGWDTSPGVADELKEAAKHGLGQAYIMPESYGG